VSREWPPTVRDPDGRLVVFDAGSHLHLVRRLRGPLLDRVDDILDAVRSPDFREDDPVAHRERFYRQGFDTPDRWLRVVVDFSEHPAWVVTAFVEDQDPRVRRR
jgi:Domain of unknown function (DUF4258)